MRLADALGFGERELVALVGAGGKKTAAAALVRAAGRRGLAAGYTTTTHTPPPPELALALADPGGLPGGLPDERPLAFARERVADPERADQKVRGFDPATVDEVFDTGQFDWLLVKADGARRREFKAPGPDEPPVPGGSTVVVVLASAKAVGHPLDGERVHRPERVAALAGTEPGGTVTPGTVAATLAHPEGGLKNVPEGARAVAVLNKADTPAEREAAHRAVAGALGRTDRFDAGLVASFEEGRVEPVG